MAAAGRVICVAALLTLGAAQEHNDSAEADTYHVSVGHLFLLRCFAAEPHSHVIWKKGGGDSGSLPAGVEVRGGVLWFLPVQQSHHGAYTCEQRSGRFVSLRGTFRLMVSDEECPDPPETVAITVGVNGGLPCKQKEIRSLNTTKSIQWMKNCQPVQREPEPIHMSADGFLWLHKATLKDSGKYTCLIDVNVDGTTYRAARSIQLTVEERHPDFFSEIHILTPQQTVTKIQKGWNTELQCLAFMGFSEDPEIVMYWTINGTFADEFEEVNESWNFVTIEGKVYGQSKLFISEVRSHFMNVPIHCHVTSPADHKVGVAWLQKAEYSTYYKQVGLCLLLFLAVLGLSASFLFFRVDLILAFRSIRAQFSKTLAADGKLYDAYVSFHQPASPSLDMMEKFVFQLLPEEMEMQRGYSLYIRGRDDCPGEAVHDAIAAKLKQCRRLILILPATEGKPCQESQQEQLQYEQTVGLHDALMLKDLKVILVEIGGPVDYSVFPESLRFIKRKQGALKWRTTSSGNKYMNWVSNKRFWKYLRHRMPAVPTRKLQSAV